MQSPQRVERISLEIPHEMLQTMPSHIALPMEQWIEKRCRLTGGRVDWFELPESDSRIISGRAPKEVVDLFCAIRIGYGRKVEDILSKEYE